jgi:predicted AAA+ superfamily ATPase
VDLLIGKKVAIEIKSTSSVTERTLKGLKALKEEGIFTRYIVVSLDPEKRVIDGTFEVIPVQQFLTELWRGGITN